MLIIQQDSRLNNLQTMLNKHGSTHVHFNTQVILDDIARIDREIEKLEQKMDGSNYRINIGIQNYKNISNYLKRLYKKAEKGSIEVNWYLSNGIVKSSPVELRNIDEYKVYVSDYITTTKTLIHVDFSEMANIIAFEIMHRDLDESKETIEEKLQDVGIIAVYDAGKLTKYFDGSPYAQSKILRVSDSPYRDYSGHTICDYFGISKFPDKTYMECVQYSCQYAMSLIVESIVTKLINRKSDSKIAFVSNTGLYVIINNSIEEMQETLGEPIGIRAFGRKFEVKPALNIY